MTERRSYPWGAALASLGMGLAVFLVLESAIARRMGWDLILPAAEGVFLPGRLARLGACLVALPALGLTGRGRAILAGWDRACQKDRWRWLTAAVLAGLFLLWTVRVTVLTYMTIDEVSFLQAIANFPDQGLGALHNVLAHSAQENASSLSIWLAAFIGLGHCIDPDGYWYLGYHMVMLWLSLTVVGRCVLVKTSRRGWPVWTGLLVTALLGGGVYLYTFARIAFTVTAGAAGTAAVALMLCRHEAAGRAGRVAADVLSGVFMVLCALQRRASVLCLFCFWALAIAYELLLLWRERRPGRGRAALCLILACVLVLAVIGGAYWTGDRLESDEHYREAEYYRSRIIDYLYDDLTYEQYERAGVPQELATLLQGWFFMDRRIDTDLFRSLAGIYEADRAAQPAVSLSARVLDIAGRLAAELWEDNVMRAQTCLILALGLLCLALWPLWGRRYVPQALCALCAAGGALLLLMYLIKDGRFPIRVFLVISLPTAVTMTLMALEKPDGPPKPALPARVLAALFAAGAAVCCVLGMLAVPHVTDDASRAQVFSEQTAIEAYADAHPDKTIVTSIFDARGSIADPLHPIDAYPANRVIWGYIGDTAKAPEDRLYADAFFRDDVLYMSDRFSSLVGLLQYLSAEYGPVQADLDSQLSPTASVTDISLVCPEENYTGWYECNGLTYYFQHGQALTGQQTIGGREYTFAPAGAQAQLITVTDDSIVYTTDAYSLQSGD